MTRGGRARAAALALALSLPACGAREGAPPPSFVLVLADDLGWADVGFQGSRFHRTPELDRLAAEGLVFPRAYAASPVCSPSRAALVSGQAPARLHLTSVLGANTPSGEEEEIEAGGAAGDLIEPRVVERLPAGAPTLATRLAERGYATAWIGKWHLGGRPGEAGFELALADSEAGAVASHFSPYGLATLADGPPGEYLTDRLTDEAVRFLESAGERPFLLVLSHYAPHLPLQAPEELVRECAARVDPAGAQRNPVYAAMVERLDASAGRVRAALERLGLAERTLVLFTSDNGGFEEKRVQRARRAEGRAASDETVHITSNAPLREGKGRCYEGGLRVPLVAWGGVVGRRGSVATPVIGTDLAPTLLALAGARALETSDGADLSALLGGGDAPRREALAFHFPHNASQSALVAGDEKLVHLWREDRDELYDLGEDAGEARDLAGERPERAAEMRRELEGWLDAVGADRPRRR